MDIFSALADPTRRNLIERLHHQGPMSIKQLTEGQAISRQALTKHLDRLVKARIVRTEFVGKERIHHLNEKAIAHLFDWIAPFADAWDARLNTLKNYLEQNDD